MRDFFSVSISLLIELLRERPWDVYGPIRCQRQHRRLNLFSSITVVLTLESPIKLETFLICVFLSKEGELRTECRDVQFRYFLIELLRKEVDFVLVGCGIIPIRQQIKLQQHWFVKDHEHQEGMMTDVPEQRR